MSRTSMSAMSEHPESPRLGLRLGQGFDDEGLPDRDVPRNELGEGPVAEADLERDALGLVVLERPNSGPPPAAAGRPPLLRGPEPQRGVRDPNDVPDDGDDDRDLGRHPGL